MKTIHALGCAIILTTGCASTECFISDANTVKIDVTEALKTPSKWLENEANQVKVIQLETSEKTLVEEIKTLQIDDDRIFILDRLNKGSIVIFDTDGNFIKRIPTGQGPGEITLASYMYYDLHSKLLYVHDESRQAVLSYDSDGNYLSSLQLNALGEGIAIDGDKILLLQHHFQSKENGNTIKLVSFDIKGNGDVRRSWNLGREDEVFSGLMTSTGCFQSVDDGFSIRKQFDRELLYFKDDTIKKRYQIIDENYHMDFSKYKGVIDMYNNLSNDDFIFSGTTYETKDIMYLRFFTRGLRAVSVYYDKSNGKVWSYKTKSHSFANKLMPRGVYDYNANVFFSILRPEFFCKTDTDYSWDGTNMDGKISDEDMGKLRSIKPDDNPVIVLYKLK